MSIEKGNNWLDHWMRSHSIVLWGFANLEGFETPKDEFGSGFIAAISMAFPMDKDIMYSIQRGPNHAYAKEYEQVNTKINEVSSALALEINKKGYRAYAIAASVRTDVINIKGEFPHKTAATRAGIGWIGRHCQLITIPFGPWVRLGTVFTDLITDFRKPANRSYCGVCMRCVESCPAKALKGNVWHPGIARDDLLDVTACDNWKKEHYYQFNRGHNCGICTAVCPYGLKTYTKHS